MVAAVNVTVVPGQMVVPGEALTLTVGATTGVSEIVIVLLVAVAGLTQPELLVSSHVTKSPFTSVDELKFGEFVPTGVPFTFHTYIGAEPPLTVVAVN